MAVVYRARQLTVGREVAVKVIKPDVVDGEQLLITFADYARTAAADGEGIAAPKPRSRAKPKGPGQESLF